MKGPGMKTSLQYCIMNGTPVEVFGFPEQYITFAGVIPRFTYSYGMSGGSAICFGFFCWREPEETLPLSSQVTRRLAPS